MFEMAREILAYFPQVIATFMHPLFLGFVALLIVGWAFMWLSRLFGHGYRQVKWGLGRMAAEKRYQKALLHPKTLVSGSYMGKRYLDKPAGWGSQEWRVYQYLQARGERAALRRRGLV